MTNNNFADTLNDLEDLLEAERQALLAGDLGKIARLVDRKEVLIDALSDMEIGDFQELDELKEKFKRNQIILDSALEGIRRVARRLATVRRVRVALDTYDADGARKTIDLKPDGTFEKRA